jgi:hypothetical protein
MSFLSKLFGTKSHSKKETTNAAEGGHTPTQAQPTELGTKDNMTGPKIEFSVPYRQMWQEAMAKHMSPPCQNDSAAPAFGGSQPFTETRIFLGSDGTIHTATVCMERADDFTGWCRKHKVASEERLVDGGTFSDGRAFNIKKLFLSSAAGLSVRGNFTSVGIELECTSRSREEFIWDLSSAAGLSVRGSFTSVQIQKEFIEFCLLICSSSVTHGIYVAGTLCGNMVELQKHLSANREAKDLH